MKTTISLYTSQEQEFLQGVLELLKLNYTKRIDTHGITHADFYIEGCENDIRAITSMMRANYEKNF